MSAETLRRKYTRDFARMSKYSHAFAWCVLAGYVLQGIVAVLAGSLLLSLPFHWALAPAIILLVVFIGTRFRALNNIIHECSHATFSSTRTLDTKIGKLCAVFLFSSFSDYRDEHLSHHAHLGDYDRDLDLQGIKDLNLHEPLSRGVIARHVLTPFFGRHLPYYLNLDVSIRDGAYWLIAKFALLFFISALTILFPLTLVLFVLLPFVLVYSALNYWADCFDHAGIVDLDDELHASRNIIAPKLVRAVFFPRSDCFHLVHHLFPHVPSPHLEASHKILVEEPAYRACRNAVSGRDLESGWESPATHAAE